MDFIKLQPRVFNPSKAQPTICRTSSPKNKLCSFVFIRGSLSEGRTDFASIDLFSSSKPRMHTNIHEWISKNCNRVYSIPQRHSRQSAEPLTQKTICVHSCSFVVLFQKGWTDNRALHGMPRDHPIRSANFKLLNLQL